MVKFSELVDRFHWTSISNQIRKYRENPDEHQPPSKEQVIKELRDAATAQGSAAREVPPEVCAFIADDLEKKVKRRRGPKGVAKRERPDIDPVIAEVNRRTRDLLLGLLVKEATDDFRGVVDHWNDTRIIEACRADNANRADDLLAAV